MTLPILPRDIGLESDASGLDPAVLAAARLRALAGATYVQAADGLAARVVNKWVDRKVHFVDRYSTMFATGMKSKWPRRAYVELFAGPGVSYNKARNTFMEGSAIRALHQPFTDYVFIDIDPIATRALESRINILQALGAVPGKQIKVLTGDCNRAALSVPALIGDALPLIFVDPTNWQVRMDTLRRIATRRADLLVTFHVGAMRRMRAVSHTADLDAFFGDRGWLACLDRPRGQVGDCLLQLYNRGLEAAGYLPDCFRDRAVVRNTKGGELYELVLFTKHERGLDFWRKSLRFAESGQDSFGWPHG